MGECLKEKGLFLTSLKQTCSEYLIKFSENQSAPKLENRKTSPCSPCAPNLPHVLLSRIPGYHNLCSPVQHLSVFTLMALEFVIKRQININVPEILCKRVRGLRHKCKLLN